MQDPAAATSAFLEAFKTERKVLKSLRSLVKRQLIVASALYFLEIVATLATPIAINFLLSWSENLGSQVGEKPLSQGIVAVVFLSFAAATSYIADHWSEKVAKQAGGFSRLAACGAVFEALLADPSFSASATSSGELLSLFSNDADSLVGLWFSLIAVALQPLEVLGAVVILFFFVKLSAFGGLGVVIAAIVVSHYCGRKVEHLSSLRSSCTDLRLRDLYEALLGMRVIKMQAMEDHFCRAIFRLRGQEGQFTKQIGGIQAVINTVSSNSVDLISLAIVLLYVFALGNEPSPAIIFSMWVCLGILHARIFHFPSHLKHVTEGLSAAKRIEAFLLRSGHDSKTTAPLPLAFEGCNAETVVRLEKASFSWSSTAPPQLIDVNLTVKKGELVAVCGAKVGSGRSTLIASILGETKLVSGAAEASKRTAFVPQTAWVLPGLSARDNILLHRKTVDEEARYQAVVEACALRHDFELWPSGDATLISGTAVSGGQRQRISLARAVYSMVCSPACPDLFLLDDVVSALDVRVGRQVIEEALLGIVMKKKNKNKKTAAVTKSMQGAEEDGKSSSPGSTAPAMVVVTSHPRLLAAADRLAVLVPAPGFEGVGVGVGVASSSSSTSVPHTLVVKTLNEHLQDARTADIVRALLFTTAANDGADGASADDVAPLPSPDADAHAGADTEPSEVAVCVTDEPVPANTIDNAPASTPQPPPQQHPPAVSSAPRPPLLSFVANWLMGVGGVRFAVPILLLLLVEAAAVEVGVYFLSLWTADPSYVQLSRLSYGLGYSGFVLLEQAGAFLRQLVYVAGVLKSSDGLHNSLILRIASAPFHFFGTERGRTSGGFSKGASAGSILSLFSRDVAVIDSVTFYASEYLLVGASYAALIVVALVAISAWTLIPLAASLMILYLSLREPASDVISDDPFKTRSLSRLIAVEESRKIPLAERFVSCLEGATSIRAFAAQDYFRRLMHGALAAHAPAQLAVKAAQSRRVLEANLAGWLFYSVSVALIVPLRLQDSISSGIAGFLVVNAAFSSSMLNLVIENYGLLVQVRSARSSLLRAAQDIPQEQGLTRCILPTPLDDASMRHQLALASSYHEEIRWYWERMKGNMHKASALRPLACPPPSPPHASTLPATWPSRGTVSVRNLRLRYDADGPLVLRGVSFELPAGARVSIVGRTGAGKTSVVAALLRLVEPFRDSTTKMEVDGVDLLSVPLQLLRSRLGIVSQDQLFFTGDLRRNLDPFGEVADDGILLSALQDVGMASPSANAGSPLDMMVAERGSSLSVGEQQLLAAARALLRRPVVTLADEVTASLTASAEEKLQHALNEAITPPGLGVVLQIAHRLAGVVSSANVVLVMDQGKIVEAGHPWQLLDEDLSPSAPNSDQEHPRFLRCGLFSSMVAAVSEPQRTALREAAKKRFESTDRDWLVRQCPWYLA